MAFKLTIIGAGSLTFARTLFSDIMHVPELRGLEVSFTDISQQNLDMVTQLCQRDLEANGIPTKIHATTDRREALKGARYIVNCVRIGGLEAFETDIDIPLKYGVDQCVGDTLCIGGIMYGQRGIAALLDFCKDIREVAEPGALLLNYSNPMAMLTWACIKYGGVRTVGLCHGEIHGEMQIAEVLGLKDRHELDIICAGLNHQTWYLSVKHNGEELRDRLLEGFEKHETFRQTEKVRIDVLRRFGRYSTESNGHLSEYVAWYRKRPDEIEKWIDLSSWINGETGGYLRETRENRNWFVIRLRSMVYTLLFLVIILGTVAVIFLSTSLNNLIRENINTLPGSVEFLYGIRYLVMFIYQVFFFALLYRSHASAFASFTSSLR